MIEKLKSVIGYWEVWHLALSMPAFMIAIRFFHTEQKAFMAVMALALLWEIGEWIYEKSTGYKSYNGSVYNFKKNSLKDLLMALIGSLICISLL